MTTDGNTMFTKIEYDEAYMLAEEIYFARKSQGLTDNEVLELFFGNGEMILAPTPRKVIDYLATNIRAIKNRRSKKT